MTAITIPKNLTKKGDLVIIPRSEYEKFLFIFKIIPKDQWWFWTKEWQNKEREADEDIRLKRVNGPYESRQELKSALNRLKKQL